ncbi:hypothetical protein NDU88_004038 [Pleurodeles waltl]|uniref:Uncharacterized protein n=1 Tax=Pleurodeles waltl TaxID=8319 RepID=A0AAV7UG06_PLEWA|nr:hypothetical protein NDU88_004038 [Pleurodeles waltl]
MKARLQEQTDDGGAPLQADTGKLEYHVLRLFRHVVPDLEEESLILDWTHRAWRPSRTPGMPKDILTCLHSYRQKELIMATVRDKIVITFEGEKLSIFQDLSSLTLQRRHMLQPAATYFREQLVRYKWGHPFYRIFEWQNEAHVFHTLEEAHTILGFDIQSVEDSCLAGLQNSAADARNQKRHHWGRKKPSMNPSESNSIKEQTALLNQLRQQGSASEAEND